jgi:3'(2'), 5'-bisphosphate nucleotidase
LSGEQQLRALDDHALAATLAHEAGRLLVDLRARLVDDGADGRTLKDEGDRQAHELLMSRLAAARPDDAVLSEESAGSHDVGGADRLGAERVWIVDPLDGTREFGEPPRADWAVHVALVGADGVPLAGAVALPGQRVVLSTSPPPPLPPAPPGRPRVIVSRSRPPAIATQLAEAIGGDLVPMGSAGAKAAAVVLGAADVYPHAGGQYEWDSCAPVAVALAAGIHASRLDGSPLRYNNPDPYLPDLLVCHPSLADAVLAALASFDG